MYVRSGSRTAAHVAGPIVRGNGNPSSWLPPDVEQSCQARGNKKAATQLPLSYQIE